MSKPSDICIVLSALPAAHEDGWIDADGVAHRLERLGFERPRTQQVAAWLGRLSRMDLAPIQSDGAQANGWGKRYRVTPYGRTWLHNRLPDIWWAQANSRDRERQAA